MGGSLSLVWAHRADDLQPMYALLSRQGGKA
jgi:hypothetical protein